MESLEAMAVSFDNGEQYVPLKEIGQHACEDIHDVLMSYYEVSRKRFIDVICQHILCHYLLEDKESPLQIWSP